MQHRTIKLTAVAVALTLASAGAHAEHRQQDAAVIGGVLGAVAGAMVGQQSGTQQGVVTGALIGAATGAALGASTVQYEEPSSYGTSYGYGGYGYGYAPQPVYAAPVYVPRYVRPFPRVRAAFRACPPHYAGWHSERSFGYYYH